MSEQKMKIQEKKRYILWLISLVVAIIFFVIIASSAMVPGKYLALLGVLFLAIYGALFLCQLRWGKFRFVVSMLAELLLVTLCIGGISVLYQTTKMMKEITEQVAETELISIYVLSDGTIESVEAAADSTWGMAENQSKEAVTQLITGFSEEWKKEIVVESYADMFEAADALKGGEIQVLVLNEAFAALIPEIEGYEWFATDTKVLESHVEEVIVVKKDDMDAPGNQEQDPGTIARDEQDGKNDSSQETSGKDGKEPETVKMELMEAPEQVDWDALVNQEMLSAPEGSFVVYISGVDTWGKAGTKSRSDVNILAVVNTVSKKVLLISTPRDYYVPLAVSNGVKDKLTHAGLYGISNSMETLELLYGVDIQYYVRVNFTGFVGIIDALGGIDVYSDTAFSVGDAFSYTEGVNHMSGIEALAFARERYALPGGDRARGNHQMEVIKAVIQKCASSSILYNYSEIMNKMAGCFSTNMSQEKMASLVRMQLNDMAQWEITSISVDGTGDKKTTYTMPGQKSYVMVPDEETVRTAKDNIMAVLQ